MKSCWANGLQGLLLLTLLLGGRSAFAQSQAQKNAAPPTEAPAGAKIVDVRVVNEHGKILVDNPKGIPVKSGEPLTPDQVAESIRVLYRTGDYADLRAVATPVEGGMRLDFKARENLFVSQVLVEGLKTPPTEASAVATMQLSLGQTYHSQDVDEALDRLRDLLRDEGLYLAKVTATQQPDEFTHQINIIAHVDPGPRVRLSKIDLINNTEYRDPDLIKLTKLSQGRELTVARVQSSTERLRKFLEKKGHLSARVSVRRGEYNPATNMIPLTLEVSEGPRVLVVVEGAKISKGDLKKIVPIYQEGSVDTDLLEEGKRNLRERMERNGYFDARVEYSVNAHDIEGKKTGRKGSEETITYEVAKGDKSKLLSIEFVGNHYFSTEILRSRLTISPSSLFTHPRFSQRLMDSDALSMKNLYAANGFLSARVETKTERVPGKSNDLIVRFLIDEGKQTLVADLKIEGGHAISEQQILSVVGSSPGQPFSDINVAADRDNILALYYNEGFPNATFTYTAEAAESSDEEATGNKAAAAIAKPQDNSEKDGGYKIERAQPMVLTYKIEEGEQFHVRSVFLTGYNHTRPKIIRREVKVTPGGPLREGEIVESQQKLYNLGVFNRVTIEPQNATGTDPDKDVVVLVEEAKRYTIAYGGGFEAQRLASTSNPVGGQVQASPRGILEISKQNLTGRADSLTLKLRASTIQWRALLGYNAPNAFENPKFTLQANTYVEKTQDINTFTEIRYEGNIQITQQLSSFSRILYRYSFRKVTVSNLNIPSDEIPLFNQPTLVSQFSTTWFRDTRDNPADAHKGSFNSANFAVSGTAIGSSASFLSLFFQNSGFTPLKKNWVYARSIRLGVLVPYASTVSLAFPAQTGTPPAQVIPLPERLFAGGGSTLRGFALNQAGPRDSITGFPVGGQAMIILNQELRFPLKVPFAGKGLGGAFFYDGGNSYSQLSHVNLRWLPPAPVFRPAYPGKVPDRFNPQQCVYNCTNELNYWSNTIGFGLRYATPVGPIRVDLGYELNRPQFVIPCPNSSVFCQQGTRLPRLQVFFNLGSSF
jgi:outer membrane protein insertion porin family